MFVLFVEILEKKFTRPAFLTVVLPVLKNQHFQQENIYVNINELVIRVTNKILWFQLTFDSFTLGRFVSFTSDGCPDGALHIRESNRPQVDGSWCGTSWVPAIYYSETNSVTISVNLYRLSKDQSGYNFDFRMEYKLLKKALATVRYGGGR